MDIGLMKLIEDPSGRDVVCVDRANLRELIRGLRGVQRTLGRILEETRSDEQVSTTCRQASAADVRSCMTGGG